MWIPSADVQTAVVVIRGILLANRQVEAVWPERVIIGANAEQVAQEYIDRNSAHLPEGQRYLIAKSVPVVHAPSR